MRLSAWQHRGVTRTLALCPAFLGHGEYGAVSELKNSGKNKNATAIASLVALIAVIAPGQARADIALLAPPKIADGDQPLRLTLLVSADTSKQAGNAAGTTQVPATLVVTLSNGDSPPAQLTLQRDPPGPETLHLRVGEYRKVTYAAAWPQSLRGTVRIDPIGFDSSPLLLTLNRAASAPQAVASERAAEKANQPAAQNVTDVTPGQVAAIQNSVVGRLSFYEPIFIDDGENGHNTARFQLSFKYRIVVPNDPNSKRLLDNLYFGYTQASIWDLTAESKPFRDTSYKPAVFYYVPDVGWHSPLFTTMGFQAGLEHESNGQSGAASRSINTVFMRPTWQFGNVQDYHLTFSPKVYYYLQNDENPDIARYRGYADINFTYGKPDGFQLATTLRKGVGGWRGSVDSQATYPLAKLFGSAFGGYLLVEYFNGYGEDILDYNQRNHWIARVGYAITR
jgi:outer membrane phospholipase A